MSLNTVRHHLRIVQDWALIDPIATAERGFPFDDLDRAFHEDTFEAARTAIDRIDAWTGKDDLAALMGHKFPADDLAAASLTLQITLPYYDINPDGTVTAVPHDARRTHLPRTESLARAAIFHDCPVSVFRRPLTSEAVYDGREALEAGPSGLKDLAPVGTVAKYKVTVLNGTLQIPPLWPSSITVQPDSQNETPSLTF